MAAPTRIFSMSLGMQTVSLAEFKTVSGGGLVLSGFGETQLVPDPAADATRSSQLKIAASELREQLRAKGARVNYAVSAQSVFTRFVKLPSVGEEQVDQIIAFEAQQNVPFPIDEVVWDYQLVGGEEAGKIEVVLVAIKSDLLSEVNEAVEEAGFATGIVDVAPMALYNAFRYNYSDVQDCALLIDIGARTTNLIFIEAKKVFSRSIPIGGNTITQALAKDFEEPMLAAEERKKRDGFVSLGGSYAEPSDASVSRVSKLVRNTMTRLHSEITRSIHFYRSQQQGGQPVRAFLCGGGSGLPYMREFFHEKLQMPIEFFNALRNVSVAPGVDSENASRRAHAMGELVGLALRSTSDCPMELNLRPISVARRQELAKRQPFLIGAAVCLVLALAGWWLFYQRGASVLREKLESLSPRVAELKNFEGRFSQLRKEIQEEKTAAEPLVKAVEERAYWVKVIEDINSRLPAKDIWLTLMEPGYFAEDGKFTSMAPKAGGGAPPPPPADSGGPKPPGPPEKTAWPAPGLNVRGLYFTNEKQASVIDDFVARLAESPYFDIDLTQRTWFNPVRATPTDTEWAFPFELRLKLKNPPFAR